MGARPFGGLSSFLRLLDTNPPCVRPWARRFTLPQDRAWRKDGCAAPGRRMALKSLLTPNETRAWHGWHRHVALVMLAFAMLVAVRHQAGSTP
jgi:hypothetical protein